MISRFALVGLLLSFELSTATAETSNHGRFVLLPIKDGELVILLDTATGQNWSAKPIENWSTWPTEENLQKTSRHKAGSMPRAPINWYPNFFVTREHAAEITVEGQSHFLPLWSGQFLPPRPDKLGKPGPEDGEKGAE